MNRIIVILLITLKYFCSYSQEFKIIRFDFSTFPEMSAIFEATDESGKIIKNAQPSDFRIEENNKIYEPSEVINAQGENFPVSLILVLDNSGSMALGRLEMAKKGISIFLKTFPFETCEIALESFSDDIIVNTDYTQKPERVAFTLNSIMSLNGTNFNNAFLKTASGAIELTERAMFKKIIIFISDGLSNANAYEIYDKALSSGVQVHCLIVDLGVPKDLEEVSLKTGGTTYGKIKDEIQLANLLTSIVQTSQIMRYGTVKWITDNNCNANRNIKITFNKININSNYIVPADKIASLEVNPNALYFGTVQPGNYRDSEVEIMPHRGIFNVTEINTTKPNFFSISGNSVINTMLFPDSVYKVNVRYSSQDVVQISDQLRIATKECPDKTVKLLAGSDEQIQIIQPAGGEVFVPGMDTIVEWAGISGKRKVDIFFRSSPAKEWKNIGNGSKWKYRWLVASDTGNKCQIKLSSERSGLMELKASRTLKFQGNIIKSATFNSDGTYLAANDNLGFVVVWNTLTGIKERVYGGFKYENATFYDQNNTLVLFNDEKITLLKNSESIIPSNYKFSGNKVYTSMCFDNGNEELISAYMLSDKAGFQRIWMPGTGNVFLNEKQKAVSASFAAVHNCVVTLSEKSQLVSWHTKTKQLINSYSVPDWFVRAIICDSSGMLAVTGTSDIHMLALPELKTLWTRNNLSYIKFSQAGKQLFAIDTSGNYCFIDCFNGNTLFSFRDYTFYQSSPSDKQIVHYSNDTLRLYDANKKSNILNFADPDIKDCRFSHDGKKILIVNGKNEIDIFNTDNGQLDETVSDLSARAGSAMFSPDNKSIAVTLSNGVIQLYEKVNIKSVKDAISNTFSIISPKPDIKDSISFGDKYIARSYELMVTPFAINNTKFPVTITGMEILDDRFNSFENLTKQFPVVLNAGQTLDCEFKFSPLETGRKAAYIQTCTATDTFITLIDGNGLTDPFNVIAFDINFGQVGLFMHKDTLANILVNKSTDTIEIESVINAGPDTLQFKLLNNKNSMKIAPHDFFTNLVQFAPKFRGLTTGYLNVFIKGRKEPQRIKLSGDGFAPRFIIVKGNVRNISDSLPLEASLHCNDLKSNKLINSINTDSSGKFELKLNSDRNYSLIAMKENFLSSSENIDLSEFTNTDTIYSDLWLTEIKSGGIIKFNCIFFEFAKSDLLDISRNDLCRIARLLIENPSVNIEIHGHTDDIGSDADNIILSGQRAKAVKDYIVYKGISVLRLKTVAFGEKVPVATNNTPEGRKANRRVEFKICK